MSDLPNSTNLPFSSRCLKNGLRFLPRFPSRNNCDGVDFEQQLGSCQRYDLHHRAGREVRSQDLAPGFVDIAMVAHIGREDAERDDIVHGSARGFDGALNLSQDEMRLRLGVADADNLAFMIRSGLAGDEYRPARLRNVDQRITAGRRHRALHHRFVEAAEPALKAGWADARVIAGREGGIVQLSAEIPCMRVANHRA